MLNLKQRIDVKGTSPSIAKIAKTPNFSLLMSIILGVFSLLTIPIFVPTASAADCSNMDRSPGWNARENMKTGSHRWDALEKSKFSGEVSGWFDKVSATCGENVGLHLSGNNRAVTINIYRMGYYKGALARLVYSNSINKVIKRTDPVTTPISNTTFTNWPVTTNVHIDSTFPTGIYMARFDDGSKTSYAPLVIRDNSATSPLLLVASTMSWQAYNTWGGWSLYYGMDKTIYNPGRVVSFNRPYDRDGKSNYTLNEAGLIQSAESAGLDISYTTDNDIDNKKTNVTQHKTLIFGGHSEYWSVNMQDTVISGRDSGINILFFGANQAYWRSRLENNGRNLVVWKGDPLDPFRNSPQLITNKWGSSPNPLNQSTLLGELFAGFGVVADYKIYDGNIWPIKGSGLITGDPITGVVGNEVDTTDRGATPGVETFLNSTVLLKDITYNVAFTYYTTANNAGVIDAGTNGWVCSITKTCSWVKTSDATSKSVAKITKSILLAASLGPLGIDHPATNSIAARTDLVEICDLVCGVK